MVQLLLATLRVAMASAVLAHAPVEAATGIHRPRPHAETPLAQGSRVAPAASNGSVGFLYFVSLNGTTNKNQLYCVRLQSLCF